MANVLTKFIPTLQMAMDEVSRELVGFIPSVARNSSAERAALNQSIVVPVSTGSQAADVTPSMTVPEPADFSPDSVSIAITKSRQVNFGLTGEEYKGLNTGLGASYFVAENFKQGVRTLCNEIEKDVGAAAAIGAGRAYGTAGTTPFASDLSDAAYVRKILDDNGAPMADRSLIIDTSAGVNLRKLTQLTNVGAAGTQMTLRDGELLPLFGLSIKESAGVYTHAASTIEGCTASAASAGAKEVTLKAATSGNFKAGDYVMFAGDDNKYLVVEDVAASVGNKIKIAGPGLREDVADSAEITLVGKAVRNVAFTRNSIQLITRAPALPGEDDSAIDSTFIQDPRSGLSFEVRVYSGYRKTRMEVALAWGVKAIKPEHIVSLLG